MSDNKRVTIYLIDPVYENRVLSNYVFPLSISFLSSYLKKVLAEKVSVEIFRFVDELEEKINRNFPDILGTTNYPWTLELSSLILRKFKKQNSNLLTVMGGSNISYDLSSQGKFLRDRPYIDYYVCGDGEIPFENIVSNYIKENGEIKKIKKNVHNGVICLSGNGDIVSSDSPFYRHEKLEEIPSPYLDGTMDKFFNTKLLPMMQTTRGCPFSCVYCYEGNKTYSKVRFFSIERVKAELDYISNKAQKSLLHITDSNFAMFPRDIEICKFIRTLQDKKNWPQSITVATGKDAYKVIKAVNILKPGTITIRAALQSTNPDTLKTIKRKNIDANTYIQLKDSFNNPDDKLEGQTILPLRMETLESHFESYRFMISAGVDNVFVHNLMMLNGTEIKTKEFRDRYNMQTRFRILPRDIGRFFGENCFEYEEICVSTNKFSLQDYKKSRFLQLIMKTVHSVLFEPLLKYIKEGQNFYEFIKALVENSESAPNNLVDVFNRYRNDAEGELFETVEELKNYCSNEENFSKVLKGEIGGNLVQTYYALLITDYAGLMVDFFIKNLAPDHDDTELENLKEFTISRYINLKNSYDEPIEKSFDYNMPEWFDDTSSKKLYEFKGSLNCTFYIYKESASEINSRLKLFGNSDQGISNLLFRVGGINFLRREVKYSNEESL